MTKSNELSNFAIELANKYSKLYDVYRDEDLNGFSLPFYAIYRRRDERYMISKKIKVYGVENQQIVFTSTCEDVTLNYVKEYQQAIEQNISEYIPEDNEHMSTIVLGIVITESDLDEKIMKEVKRYRKLKFLKLGFHGWVEMYTVLVNLKDRTIHVHPKGKNFVQSLENGLKEGVNV